MDIRITFPGGKRVDADLGSHVVHTDQSVEHGGEGSAAEPFELFLARQIPTAGIELLQHHRFNDVTHVLEHVGLELVLPTDFPEKYRMAVVRAAAGCKVKKVLLAPPEIVVSARSPDGTPLATTALAA